MTILQIKKASRGKPCQKHTNSSRKLPPGININGQESGRRVLSRKVAGRRSNEPKLKGVQNCHFLLRILEHNPSIGLVVTQLDDNDIWFSKKGEASQFFCKQMSLLLAFVPVLQTNSSFSRFANIANASLKPDSGKYSCHAVDLDIPPC